MLKRFKFLIRLLIKGLYIEEPIHIVCDKCGQKHTVYVTKTELKNLHLSIDNPEKVPWYYKFICEEKW